MAENLEKENEQLKAQIAELMGAGAPDKPKVLNAQEQALVGAACKAYGIAERFIFSSNVREENGEQVAIVVTAGGAKVRYSRSMAADKAHPIVALEAVAVDGIIRKKMKPVGKK